MRKNVLRVVAMLLVLVLISSELKVATFAEEILLEDETVIEDVEAAEDAEDVLGDDMVDDTEEIEETIDDDQGEILQEEELASDESDIIEEELLIEEPLNDDATDGDVELCDASEYFTLYGTMITGLTAKGKSQEHLEIPEGITAIFQTAFSGADGQNIKSITLPNSLEEIGANAFYGIHNLTSITIPENVTYIGQQAFYSTGLKEVTINSNKLTNLDPREGSNQPRFGGNNIKNIYFGENVTVIPKYLFEGAQFDSEVGCDLVIPKQITKIDDHAFEGASYLHSLLFEQGSKCTAIGNYAFRDAFALGLSQRDTSLDADYCYVDFPSSLKTIGDYAFQSCVNLRKGIVIPIGTTTIGKYAFNDIVIEMAVVPKTVTKIGEKAFTGKSVSPYTILVAVKDSYAYKWFRKNMGIGFLDLWTVTYNLNGGTNNPSNVTEFFTGATCDFEDPTRDGYIFDGWYEDSKLTKRRYKLDGTEARNIVLYAKWLGEECTVSYNLNDNEGTTEAEFSGEKSFKVNSDSPIPALAVPTREGYAFSGWFTQSAGGVQLKQGAQYAYGKNQTVYAHWTPVTYTLKLHSNLNKDTYKTYTLSFDDSKTIIVPFTKIGSHVAGYSKTKNGEMISDATVTKEENGSFSFINLANKKSTVDLYACWEEDVYTVSFNFNQGKQGDTPNSIQVKYNMSYEDGLEGGKWPDGENAPTREGYTFLGWYNEAKVPVNKETVNLYTEDNELTAYWKAKPSKDTISKPKFYIQIPGKEMQLSSEIDDMILPLGTRIMITADPGCQIYYCDESYGTPSNPTTNGILYQDEFVVDNIDEAVDIRAVACKDGVFGEENRLQGKKEILVSYYNQQILGDLEDYPEDIKLLGGYYFNNRLIEITIPEGFWVSVATLDNENSLTYQVWKDTDKISVRESGAAIKFDYLHVYYGNKLLKEKTDYTIAYKNNTKPAADDQPTMTISLKGNYSGKIIRYFNITEALTTGDSGQQVKAANIKKYFVTVDTTGLVYDGKEKKPAVKVKPSKKSSDAEELLLGRDYDVQYYNNTNAGKATLVITGIDEYYGVITKTFTIAPFNIKTNVGERVKPSGDYATYSEVAKWYVWDEPFKYISSGITVNDPDFMKDGSEIMRCDSDFTVKYANNKAVGNFDAKKAPTITVTGKGNYTGTYSVPIRFSIEAANIADTDIIVSNVVWKNKAGLKPEISIYDKKGNKLKGGKDYKALHYYTSDVTVVNNKKDVARHSGDLVNSKDIIPGGTKMRAAISGINNFQGNKDITYSYVESRKAFISADESADVMGTTVSASNVIYADKPGILKPTVTITQTAFGGAYKKVLKAGTDYKKTFTYEYAEDTFIKQKNKKTVTYLMRQAGDAVDLKKDILPVGAKIRVKIEGINNYKGAQAETYCYVLASLKSAKVSVKPQTYTGRQVYVNKSDITVTIGKGKNMTTLSNTDYEIVGYKNNNSKGKGKLTIRGIGDYTGTKEVTFTINPLK